MNKTHPEQLSLMGAVFFMFGTCAGVSLLNHYSFLNPLAILFYALALLVFVPALFKYFFWGRQGLLQPFPDGTVLWQLNHVLSARSQYYPGMRVTTTEFYPQHVVFVLPKTGTQNMTVVCDTCQQEAMFRVDSLHMRKVRRVRMALISLAVLVVTIVLGVAIGPSLSPNTISWLWLIFIVLLFGSIGFLWNALQYTGVSSVKLPRGHKAHPFLKKAELKQYRNQALASSSRPPTLAKPVVLQSQDTPERAEESTSESQTEPRPANEKRAEKSAPGLWKAGDVLLGQYEIVSKLGEGGMGTVYKAHYRAVNVDLALKIPRPTIFARAGGKKDFIREAETWVKLREHPHLVTCHLVSMIDDIPCIFADYIDGGSLLEWIRQRRLYEGGPERALERILDVAIQFAWGLHAAHEQGLVHQDVKPANVMMTADGLAKVTDFGLARARTLAGEENVSESILVSSGGMTPAYCSPEQASRQPLSHKTDIWSWGVSVLEMFVGKVTWMVGATAREALASHQRQDAVIPQMPPELVTLLGRCLQPRPEDRPITMLEVANELQALYERLVGEPYPREVPTTVGLKANRFFIQAYSLSELERKEEALAAFEQAIRLDPSYAAAYQGKGITLLALERKEEALAAFEQAIQISPTSAETYRLKGSLLMEQGQREEALAALEQAIQIDPTFAETYRLKGLLLSQQERAKEATTAFEQAIRLNPDSLDASNYYTHGLLLMQLGRLKEAVATFEHAIRLNSTATTYYIKSVALYQLKRYKEALTALEQTIQLDPTLADAYRLQGGALTMLNRNEEALLAFEQAIRLDPTSGVAYTLKGVTLFALHRNEEALTVLEQAIQLNPTDVEAYAVKGRVLNQLKRREEAKQAQQKAQELRKQR